VGRGSSVGIALRAGWYGNRISVGKGGEVFLTRPRFSLLVRGFPYSSEGFHTRPRFSLLVRGFPYSSEVFLTRPRISLLVRGFPYSSESSLTRPRFSLLVRGFPYSSEDFLTHPRVSSLVRGFPYSSEVFLTRPDWPCVPATFLNNGYRAFFPGVKRPRCGVDHPARSSVEVKERVEQYIYSLSAPSRLVLGWTLP